VKTKLIDMPTKITGEAEEKRRRALVDELGDINVSRAEAIKKEIREVWMKDAKPEVTGSFPGDRHVANVTARKMEREVDTRKVYKFKGIKWLLEFCRIPVGIVEDHVALPDRVGMITSSQSGSRSVSVGPLLKKAA
jgi:hypothetical protein